jgi:hypothetical protein
LQNFRINKLSGGSTLTKINRSSHLDHFDRVMRKELNSQYQLKSLSVSQASKYFEACKAQGTSIRTLQNRAASLRAALESEGRGHFATTLMTNAGLGISGGSRLGTHVPATPDVIKQRIAGMSGGAAAAAQLQKQLGLRAREAVSCGGSLQSWSNALSRGATHLSVVHGTKGGRPRDVRITGDRAALSAAIGNALSIAKKDGQLVKSTSLGGACRSYGRALAAAGFKGAEASHSLRYAFAREQFAAYKSQGVDEREALAMLSQDLGHGDGRGTYCKAVYLRG